MALAPRTQLVTGGYQRTNGLAGWWWRDGRDGSALDVVAAGNGGATANHADLDSPSFVCRHPTLPLLYAVSELDEGMLTTVSVAPDGSLTALGSMPTGGAQPCWVTTDPVGQALLIANYDAADSGAASFAVIGLSGEGIPVGDAIVMPHIGNGPVAGRQDAAHVHQAVPTVDGNVLVSDLGTDELIEYAVAPIAGAPRGDVTVSEVGRVAMPPGSGPRHIALAANGMTGFVTGELDGTVTVIRRSATEDGASRSAGWAAAHQVPSSSQGGARANAEPGFVAPSHAALMAGDRYLLVANRGPSTLALLDVADGCEIVCEVPVSAGPRDFTVHGDTVFVACQQAGEVEVHRLDADAGTLTRRGVLRADGRAARLPGVSCIAVLDE